MRTMNVQNSVNSAAPTTAFREGTSVMTPKGRATIDEMDAGIAYVTMENGVEADYPVGKIRLLADMTAAEIEEIEKGLSERNRKNSDMHNGAIIRGGVLSGEAEASLKREAALSGPGF